VLLGAVDGLSGGRPGTEGGAGFWRAVRRAVGLMLSLWALLLLVGLAGGARDLFKPLAPFVAGGGSGASVSSQAGAVQAAPTFVPVNSVAELDQLLAQADKPVMLDFYADWCVSCIGMERFTFSDPAVAQR